MYVRSYPRTEDWIRSRSSGINIVRGTVHPRQHDMWDTNERPKIQTADGVRSKTSSNGQQLEKLISKSLVGGSKADAGAGWWVGASKSVPRGASCVCRVAAEAGRGKERRKERKGSKMGGNGGDSGIQGQASSGLEHVPWEKCIQSFQVCVIRHQSCRIR